MRRFLLVFILMVGFSVFVSSCDDDNKKCNISIIKVKEKENSVEILTKTTCKGIFLRLDKEHAFFVNLSDKVRNGAVPYGFSVLDFKNRKYISLGVDAHLREIGMYGSMLSEGSKITKVKDGFLVYFKVYTHNLPDNVTVESYNHLTIKHINFGKYQDCKNVFLMLLEKPDAFDRKPSFYTIPDFNEFLTLCISQKNRIDKNRLLVSVFRVDKDIVLNLEREGKTNLAEFLRRKFLKKRKDGVFKRCNVNLILLDSNYRVVKGRANLILEKITKQRYQTNLDNNSFFISGNGLYRIKAFYGHSYGLSSPFTCKGKYMYVVIVLKPSI